jgi:hypothetical protein
MDFRPDPARTYRFVCPRVRCILGRLERGWVIRHYELHSVGLCLHDSCPLVATVACSDIWNGHAATAWSHTIHPPYLLDPLLRTHRLILRPNVTCLGQQTVSTTVQSPGSCEYILQPAVADTCSDSQVIVGRCEDLDHPVIHSGQYWRRPCSSQT